MNKKELAAAIAAKSAEIKTRSAALDVNATDYEAKEAELDALVAEVEQLQTSLSRLERKDAREAKATAFEAEVKQPLHTPAFVDAKKDGEVEFDSHQMGRTSKLRAFKDDRQAYGFAQYMYATLFKNTPLGERGAKWCADNGIQVKTQIEGQNAAGGILVNPEFSNVIIDLREKYGIFRQNTKVVPMRSDSLLIRRRTSGLTTYWVDEEDEITASTKGWDGVKLQAKKLGVLAKITSELLEDAAIDVADDLANEIAYAISLKEDQCGFLGDGTSTYGGIYGLLPKLLANGTAGQATAAGTAFSTITLANMQSVMALLPEFAETNNVKWYCSKAFWGNVMQRLATASGGTDPVNIVNGVPQRQFLGYPVVISQVLPTSGTSGQLSCAFGDLAMASTMGTRRELAISSTSERYWELDTIGVKGLTRFDINIHDVGSSTAAGPVVALKQA